MLKQCDVIKLEKDHMVYTQLPKNIKDYCTDIKIGEIYHQWTTLKEGDEGYDPDYFEKERAKQFAPDYQGCKGIVGCSLANSKIVDSFDTSCFIGEYLVLYTTYEGGGYQGTSSGGESYNNGHRIYCKQILDGKVCGQEVNFYESGSFSAMIEDLKPIKNVNFQYEIKEIV